MTIGEVITDGNQEISANEEKFKENLENEKEEFIKQVAIFEQNFNHIKTFSNESQIYDFNKFAFNLSQNIFNARCQIEQFNERETTFSL